MQVTPQVKLNKDFLSNFLYPYIVEALIVFSILTVALIIEFYSRNLVDWLILKAIITRSFLLVITYIFIFRLAKSGLTLIFSLGKSFIAKNVQKSSDLYQYFIDIFITLAFILTTVPIRPILQKVNFQNNLPSFDQALVKYDAIPSMLILSTVGIPLIFLIAKKFRGITRAAVIAAVIASILIVGFINNKPNYQARVYESRADWIKQDWIKQGVDAEKALKDAKTDKEKAVAYYWMGVSENRKGNYNKAIEYQLKAIELDPTYGAPHSSIALAYLNYLGDLNKVKYHAEKCIELSPSYAWCYYAYAAYYDYNGEKLEAYKNLKFALELDPNASDLKKALDLFKIQNPQIHD